MGIVTTILMGSLLGGLVFPHAYRNAVLDSLPVTPISNIEPGGSVKVFATVAPNESTVVKGSWSGGGGGGTWGWSASNFWLVQNDSLLFVNVSELIYVRQPGSPWGSESGTVDYSAGSMMAAYGPTRSTPNGTVLFVQYIAPSPGLMGNANDDTWPLVAGIIAGSAAVSAVAAYVVRRYTREHRRIVSQRPTSLVPPTPMPASRSGTIREFPNPWLGRSIRRYRIGAAVGGLVVAFGALFLPISEGFGSIVLTFGVPIFLVMSLGLFNELRGVSSVLTDDSGLYIRPWAQDTESVDAFIPWSAIQDYYTYDGQLLALRTTRGEFVIPWLDREVRSRVTAELGFRGIAAGTSTVSPALVGPSAVQSLSSRDQLRLQRRGRAFAIGKTGAIATALLAGPAGFTELAFSPPVGESLLLLTVLAVILTVVLSSRITILRWRASERLRTTGS